MAVTVAQTNKQFTHHDNYEILSYCSYNFHFYYD